MDDDLKPALVFGGLLVLALLLFVYVGGLPGGDAGPGDSTPPATETVTTTGTPMMSPSSTATIGSDTTTTAVANGSDTPGETCPEA